MPTLQLDRLGQHRKHCRLAAAVTAHNRMHRANRERRVESAQHPAGRSIVAKPAPCQGGSRPSVHFWEYSASTGAQRRPRVVLRQDLCLKFIRFVRFRPLFCTRSADARVQRAQLATGAAENSVFCTSRATPPWRLARKQLFTVPQGGDASHLAHASVFNPVRARRVFEHRARLVRCHDNRAAQLAIHAKQCMQKTLLGNGIQLGRGLVEQQHARAQRQHSRQRQQLFASTRKRIGIAVEPILQPKEIAGLGYTTAHLVARHA